MWDASLTSFPNETLANCADHMELYPAPSHMLSHVYLRYAQANACTLCIKIRNHKAIDNCYFLVFHQFTAGGFQLITQGVLELPKTHTDRTHTHTHTNHQTRSSAHIAAATPFSFSVIDCPCIALL